MSSKFSAVSKPEISTWNAGHFEAVAALFKKVAQQGDYVGIPHKDIGDMEILARHMGIEMPPNNDA